MVVEGNLIRNFYQAVVYYGRIVDRFTNYRFDRNDIQSCDTGFVIASVASTACMVVEGNSFTNVTRRFTFGEQGGHVAGHVGKVDNGRMILLDHSAAPGTGTWLEGDRAEFVAPTAGGGANPNIGAVCVAGGSPGTWKTYGAIAA